MTHSGHGHQEVIKHFNKKLTRERRKEMEKIREYEIVDHGVENVQYFQGCGVAFTEFSLCVTGAGQNAKEAYEDAVDSLAQVGFDVDKLPTRPIGINKKNRVLASMGEECYYYVSIRIK
jgi:hypothetical protein